MGTVYYSYTFSGHEGPGSTLIDQSIANFAGGYSETWTLSTAANNIFNFDTTFREGKGGTVCFLNGMSFVSGDTTKTGNHTVGTPAGTGSGFWSCTDFTWYVVSMGTATSIPPAGVTLTISFTGAGIAGTGPACQYGSEPNPSASVYTVVTEAVVEAAAAALGMGPLGLTALGVLIGSPIIFPTCDNVPALPEPIVDSDFIDGTGLPNPASIGKFGSHLTYGVWNFYCQCKPAPAGQPPVVQPPKPPLPPRLKPGPQPDPPCSNADVCTALTHILNVLTTINVQLTTNNYTMPAPAYTWGALFANVSGDGEIAVSGILGAFVSFFTLPNRAGVEIGDPNTLYDVGWINFGTPDGWFPRQRITSDPWITLPEFMANVSRLGYSIPKDCAINITLLVPANMNLAAASGT